jgi:hypothetical protein
MKYCGVVYDVGLNFAGEKLSVEPFDALLVKHDMRVIARDLYANAVRIEGEEIYRLVAATRAAHEEGLTVFFNSWMMGVGFEKTYSYMEEAARAAEKLREEGVDIVFVAGCEYSIFGKGIFPGDSFNERVTWFGNQLKNGGLDTRTTPETVRQKSHELNNLLRSLVKMLRTEFGGQITYSSGTWEAVDWSLFDIVGIDYYRRGESEDEYVAGLEDHRRGKPIVVMEVGCCAYVGAAERGDGGFALLKSTNPDRTGVFVDDVVPTRSEKEQADYVETQLRLLASTDVHAVFVFVFSFPCMPLGKHASDLDMMSFSLVETVPDRANAMPPWEPKEAFNRVADFYKNYTQTSGSA